jgi:thiamine-monophosphate kinase
MSTEFQRIRWLTTYLARSRRGPGTVIGVGDDAAAWTPPSGHTTVMSVDVQNVDVHFRTSWFSPVQLGRRALSVAASDLAAMAAQPGIALVSLTFPPDTSDAFFRGLFRGIVEEGRAHGLDTIGGNLANGPLSISITVVGSARKEELVLRSGARHGDRIFVTGRPGRAGVGRALLARDFRSSCASTRACLNAFRAPTARLSLARQLRDAIPIHAMIDISDGLAADLRHVLDAGTARRKTKALRAILDTSLLETLFDGPTKRDPSVCEIAREVNLEPIDAVMAGGEDYELLFVAPRQAESTINSLASKWEVPVTCIGRVESGKVGVFLKTGDAGPRRWTGRGFDHFATEK